MTLELKGAAASGQQVAAWFLALGREVNKANSLPNPTLSRATLQEPIQVNIITVSQEK